MARVHGLNARQQAALFALLRVGADGEITVENTRCRLCELHGFDPYATFKSLQGSWCSQKGWISAYELYKWLSDQRYGVSGVPLENIVTMLRPYVNQHSELRYDGFLRLILPKDLAHAFLSEAALARGAQTFQFLNDENGRILPEIAARLCQVLEAERDLHSHLRFHQKNLRELLVQKEDVLKFLDSAEGVCAGMGGFLSPNGVHSVLVDRLQALSETQCNALLRRINPSGTCLVAFDEVAKYILPELPITQPWFSPDLGAGKAVPNEKVTASFGLADSLLGWTPAPVSPRRGRWLGDHLGSTGQTADKSSRSLQDKFSLSRSETRGSAYASPPPPRLREPLGPHSSPRAFPSLSLASTPQVGARALSNDASNAKQVGVESSYIDRINRSPATPLPPYMRSMDAHPKVERSGPPESLRQDLPPYADTHLGQDREHHTKFAWEKNWVAQGLPLHTDTYKHQGLEHHTKLAQENNWDGAIQKSVNDTLLGLFANTPNPLLLSGTSLDLDLRRNAFSENTTHDMSAPRRATSLPPSSPQIGGSFAPAPHDAGASTVPPAFKAPASFRTPSASSVNWPSRDKTKSTKPDHLVREVLQAMVRQGISDAWAEHAKALVPASCNLESIISALDRPYKGYIMDTDIWQFVQDFQGSVSFGSLCSLVHETRLRRRHDQVVLPGRLSFRDIGALVFSANSKEYEAMLVATSDAEARSILYLLRHSEPCPKCGIRIQRDANAAGCPSVICPVCGTSFHCFCIMGDINGGSSDASVPLSANTKFQLYRLFSAAARAAHEIEFDRKSLTLLPGFNVRALNDIFGYIANGKLYFTVADLKQAFIDQRISFSEEELGFVWRRYVPQGSATVPFPDFVRQLKLHTSGWSI